MNQQKPKIRLYVPEPFAEGARIELGVGQSHYLNHVMRQGLSDRVAIFNGSDGEWLAHIASAGRKHIALMLEKQIAPQMPPSGLWLAFAPVKTKTERMVEQAVELGAGKLLPVFTRHAVVRSLNAEKLHAHAVEAAEQCGRHDVPEMEERKDLSALLASWPKDRILLYGDESGGGAPLKNLLSGLSKGAYGILTGPEGGFSAEEHAMLKAAPFVKAFGLGPRILRADTAAAAALACAQSWLGDWENSPAYHSSPWRKT